MPAKKSGKRSTKRPAKSAGTVGRPGTAGKADGRGAVVAWIKRVKPEHRPIVEAIDAIVVDEVPDLRNAIKWSTPMYGREEVGWFAAVASFKEHVGVNFFNGIALKPQPPAGDGKTMRSVKVSSLDDLDAKQMRAWIRQASKNAGWGKV